MLRTAVAVVSGAVVAANLLVSGTGPIAAQQQPPAAGAQQPPAGQPPQGRGEGRRGGGGGRGPAAIAYEDRTGFQPIFDGTTMKNWDGDPAYWKVADGAIVGESTEANPIKENTFVIYRGGEPADFELKVDFRMSATNSGIQFRSTHLPQGTKTGADGSQVIAGKWVLKGYQADIDFANQFTGMIYEERGRGFLMQRGQAVYIGADAKPKMIGDLERNPEDLKGLIKAGEWNNVHLIARGNTLINIVNGHVTAVLVDDDAKGRALKGLLGFQIHVGPPMKIEFKNIYLKTL
jgi:3-keto-disaccharide hydrolase